MDGLPRGLSLRLPAPPRPGGGRAGHPCRTGGRGPASSPPTASCRPAPTGSPSPSPPPRPALAGGVEASVRRSLAPLDARAVGPRLQHAARALEPSCAQRQAPHSSGPAPSSRSRVGRCGHSTGQGAGPGGQRTRRFVPIGQHADAVRREPKVKTLPVFADSDHARWLRSVMVGGRSTTSANRDQGDEHEDSQVHRRRGRGAASRTDGRVDRPRGSTRQRHAVRRHRGQRALHGRSRHQRSDDGRSRCCAQHSSAAPRSRTARLVHLPGRHRYGLLVDVSGSNFTAGVIIVAGDPATDGASWHAVRAAPPSAATPGRRTT